MLQSIRDRAQGIGAWIIVILITVPFTMWGVYEYIQPQPNTSVAKVNGISIERADYENAVRQRRQYFRSMFRTQDISFMNEQIDRDTLKDLINQELLLQIASDEGMRIGDGLLAAQIQENPAFQENKQFSPELYKQLLSSRGLNPVVFEMQIRRDMLAQQLRESVSQSAFSTDYDQRQKQQLENQQRLVSYVLLDKETYNKQVEVSDAEVEKHYNDNSKQYMTDEQVSVEYVVLSIEDIKNSINFDADTLQQAYQERLNHYTTPVEWKARHILVASEPTANEDAIAQAKQKALNLIAQLQAGEDFAELAKQNSDDTGSGQRGGDLGWFGEGRMVKPFESAIAAMNIGDVSSELVQSEFGFHIINLQEKKEAKIKPYEEIKAELETELRQEQASLKYNDQLLDDLAELAFQFPDNLDDLANNMELVKQESGLFTQKGLKDDEIFANAKVLDIAFSEEVLNEQHNSEPVEFTDGKSVVFRIKAHQLPQLRPLDEVKVAITETLISAKTKAKVEEIGQSVLEALKQANADIEKISDDNKLVWSEQKWVSRNENFGSQAIVESAFKLGTPPENNALYQGLVLDNGNYAVYAVLDVKSETKKDDKQTPDGLKKGLGSSDYNSFLSGLKSSNDIIQYLKK
ncbi:SurA N-terminal domain-containing protein [Candidatus Albibeggiatoa sp. nov. BB20]|uniref:SurA N-terminal domain-containing protein n=1 Tax=Candidatus Albibeggiatoa sp. nov. BB20 TaxID=3162723 RepID=UPI003365960F